MPNDGSEYTEAPLQTLKYWTCLGSRDTVNATLGYLGNFCQPIVFVRFTTLNDIEEFLLYLLGYGAGFARPDRDLVNRTDRSYFGG